MRNEFAPWGCSWTLPKESEFGHSGSCINYLRLSLCLEAAVMQYFSVTRMIVLQRPHATDAEPISLVSSLLPRSVQNTGLDLQNTEWQKGRISERLPPSGTWCGNQWKLCCVSCYSERIDLWIHEVEHLDSQLPPKGSQADPFPIDFLVGHQIYIVLCGIWS